MTTHYLRDTEEEHSTEMINIKDVVDNLYVILIILVIYFLTGVRKRDYSKATTALAMDIASLAKHAAHNRDSNQHYRDQLNELQQTIEKVDLKLHHSIQEQIGAVQEQVTLVNGQIKTTMHNVSTQLKSLESIIEQHRTKSEEAEQEAIKKYRSVATTVNQLIDMMSAKVPKNLSTL